ncbi:PilZ domain-containing protein [Aeromonas hydrophila]|uniref:PilZ domain-containing protein n=1 Tax=Aeromonas hydrophila TaxID=644 RepID=UPI0005371BB5|nr:PilZ domain-containing protein [Aeromonas hydrophila]HDT5891287.1 PilZ domain-containing protein [Aeromonas hydrophila subsp. hydrophila]ELO1555495.1 PilZ domain-containing protein [Aeromonas hydrophila]MDM5118420.1 PilZ domain-containing protein [Aeromonas hydrophila]PNO61187.1 PilZ domain-containing protein [Aeromonas hydrophila]UUT60848.1 PilZ domain-containing protein [Aeromonas hydrophila]
MDHHQILTEDELAMLRDLGSDQETAAGQSLSGYLATPLLGLLQRADQLVLEARFAGHQLRFPLRFTQGDDGFVEPRIAAPVIKELGYPHPRTWRLDEQASFRMGEHEYLVHSLSLDGLVVEALPPGLAVGATLTGSLLIEDLAPLPLSAELVRHIHRRNGIQGWALHFQMAKPDLELLRNWMFQRHQDAFTQAYQPR